MPGPLTRLAYKLFQGANSPDLLISFFVHKNMGVNKLLLLSLLLLLVSAYPFPDNLLQFKGQSPAYNQHIGPYLVITLSGTHAC